eukprot:TRINITY_DN1679_c0_g1_i1.p1 TRINITY_DN1679_c0_g1~~TRINITY_DN1679_c0_g1_i1.p1  ORF type:complete len:161 (-),score=27.73 TRINITY_DN1679_c0_g1_i1:91-573(-)
MPTINVGDRIPQAVLDEGSPGTKVQTHELLAGRRVIIFGVPGAFTPGCSRTHLPGYVADFEKFRAKGVDDIVCVSVNDAFVMAEWGKAHDATGKVRMLADPRAEFVTSLGLEFDATPVLGSKRSKRFALFAEDGVVKAINVEPDGTGLTCSLSPKLLDQL